MISKVVSRRNFLAGLLFLLIGTGAVYFGWDYQMGTYQNMGPGYVPVSLGWILIILGSLNCIAAARNAGSEMQVEPVPWRALGLVILSIVAFGLLIERFGLLITVAVVVVLSTLASKSIKIVQSAISLVILLALTGLLFVYGLDQPLEYLLPH